MENRLKAKYENEIRPALIEKFNYSSVMQAPKIDKIVLNMGVGDATTNSKNLDEAVEELGLISGQKPLITKAKKSIAGFRLREGMSIGAKVTLRGERMYDFLDKLGISYETVCHAAAYTMEECQEVEKKLGVPICKNLFLCNRQQTQFYLLMLPGEKHFKTKFLSSELGCSRLSFAEEEHMVRLLSIRPGAVSPMGLMNDKEKKVMLVVDNELLQSEFLGCHPCVNTATLKIRLKDLLKKIVPAANHEYRIVTLRTEE